MEQKIYLAKIISVGKRTGTKKDGGTWSAVEIKHTNPNSKDPNKESTTLVFDTILKANSALLDKIKELEPGTSVGLTKKIGSNALIDIVDESQVPKYTPKSSFSGGGRGGFNEAAPKVGGILHDAVALTVAIEGKNSTIETVKNLAEELLRLSANLEKNWNAGTYKTNPQPTSNQSETMAAAADDAFDLDDF